MPGRRDPNANPSSRDFYAIRPLNLWHILGSYFLLIWGVRVVKLVFKIDLQNSPPPQKNRALVAGSLKVTKFSLEIFNPGGRS